MMMHPTCFLKKEDDEDGTLLQRKIFDTPPQIFCETAAEATLLCNPPQPRKAQYEE